MGPMLRPVCLFSFCHIFYILRVYGKEIILQKDTETRWSSTVAMLTKATSVKHAVDRLYNLTQLEHKDQHVYFFCFC